MSNFHERYDHAEQTQWSGDDDRDLDADPDDRDDLDDADVEADAADDWYQAKLEEQE